MSLMSIRALRRVLSAEVLSHELKHILEFSEREILRQSLRNFTAQPEILKSLINIHKNKINGISLEDYWLNIVDESREISGFINKLRSLTDRDKIDGLKDKGKDIISQYRAKADILFPVVFSEELSEILAQMRDGRLSYNRKF